MYIHITICVKWREECRTEGVESSPLVCFYTYVFTIHLKLEKITIHLKLEKITRK